MIINVINKDTTYILDYYSTLDGHQKRAVLGFLECLTNQLIMMDGLSYTQSSVGSVASTSSTATARESDILPVCLAV